MWLRSVKSLRILRMWLRSVKSLRFLRMWLRSVKSLQFLRMWLRSVKSLRFLRLWFRVCKIILRFLLVYFRSVKSLRILRFWFRFLSVILGHMWGGGGERKGTVEVNTTLNTMTHFSRRSVTSAGTKGRANSLGIFPSMFCSKKEKRGKYSHVRFASWPL